MKSILKSYSPGLLLVLCISILSLLINDLIKNFFSLEALTIAILIGILVNNLTKIPENFQPGIKFSLKKLLKLGIILLGFKLNIQAVLALGPNILILVILFIPSVLLLSVLLGKLFDIKISLALLIGVGSCICGASAIVAMAPCIHADDEDAVIAVSIISFLGAIGVIAYSAVAASNIAMSPIEYGIWSGLSLQGVAHAIAAAFAGGSDAGEIGTIVKMTRVFMLVPVSLVLSRLFSNKSEKTQAKFPIYVLLFILAGLINSLRFLPITLTQFLGEISNLLILFSMTAMGLSVNFKKLIKNGLKALGVGGLLFGIISSLSFFVITKIH